MTFLLIETEYTNQKNEKVARCALVLIETGQAVKARMIIKMRSETEIRNDQGRRLRFPTVTIDNVTRPDFVRYAGASGDFVPLHYDQTFVEAAGIPTVFAQGMCTAGACRDA